MDARDRTAEGAEAKLDVKSEVAKTLIAAMEAGDTPWQRSWKSTAMRPTNITTSNAYRGINRILLALSGRSSNLWCTYQQAAAKGWQVRRGEKGTMIVKVVEFNRAHNDGGAGAEPSDAPIPGKVEEAAARKGAALKRYWVFNAEQIDGIPQAEQEPERDFEPVAKAEAVVQALIEQTGLIVIHGGDNACYVPSLDEVRLPPARAFKSQYDMWATKMHECAHSTMHPKRLDRSDAYAKRWGDSAYALEELTAEISSAILAGETGVPMSRDPSHIQSHAGYLRSWIKAIENDPMAIFTAAKNADRICEYLLGLERQMASVERHKEWIAEYDRAT
jgi:antirestriction protein ArdC